MATHRSKWGEHEDGFRIERCQVTRFKGDGVHLECAWCFSVRHCELAYNHGDGLSLRGWDGFLLDNWFSGNKRAGFGARQENSSVTFTANRVEWNGEENMVITGADGYQITGNFFERLSRDLWPRFYALAGTRGAPQGRPKAGPTGPLTSRDEPPALARP